MNEVWLRSNRRVLFIALVPVALLATLALAIICSTAVPYSTWIGSACLIIAGLLSVGLIHQIVQPRIAYREGNVLFYLKAGGPLAVPVQVVEAFFLGQGPAELLGSKDVEIKSINLIARLSQRAPEWQEREVKPALGKWSEGYVTIRGTWCEPLSSELVSRLNQLLHEVSQQQADILTGEASSDR